MARERFVPIAVRLTGFAVAVAAAGLFTAAIALTLHQVYRHWEEARRAMLAAAEEAAYRVAPALLFLDHADATRIAQGLQTDRAILGAAVYDGDGKLFAHATRAPAPDQAPPRAPPPGGPFRKGGRLLLSHPIRENGRAVGSLYLTADLAVAMRDVYSQLWIIAGATVVSLTASFLLSLYLQRFLSGPLRRLADLARLITEKGESGHRAIGGGPGELGILVQAFNEMLDGLQQRDRRLLAAQRELEQRVEERTAELRQRNEELGRFTYSVSHDLRSPLITLRGFLDLLLQDAREGNETRMRADAAHMTAALTRMQRMLEEILELSRAGRLRRTREPVPLREIVHEAAQLLAGPLSQRGVRLEVAPDLPVLWCDRARLLQVFQNLIENAVKFMGGQANPMIAIAVEQREEGAVLTVRDNGIGIAPRFHEKIFGLFDRLDPHTEGTGIGLALVRRIVEAHGGTVWCESDGPGKGATFCLRLPNLEPSDAQWVAAGEREPACESG